MKHYIALLLPVLLAACGGDESDNPYDGQARACSISSLNGADAPKWEGYDSGNGYSIPPLVNKKGQFFGDMLSLKGTCTGGQQVSMQWEMVEEPVRSTARLMYDGRATNGGVNGIQFWDATTDFVADGKYVVKLYANYKDGGTSTPTYYEVDYIAGLYIGGDYTISGSDSYTSDLLLDNTDRPYYIANRTTVVNITIEAGVEVYSNRCNGDDRSGFACVIEATESIKINGTADAPVKMYGGVLRGYANHHAVLDMNYTNIIGGGVNYNSSRQSYDFKFKHMTIRNSKFTNTNGIVVTRDGAVIENNIFTNSHHEFTDMFDRTTISIKDAAQVEIHDNVFNDVGYAIGISDDIYVYPSNTYNAIGNSYVGGIRMSIFDADDATYDSHGSSLQFVTTINAY